MSRLLASSTLFLALAWAPLPALRPNPAPAKAQTVEINAERFSFTPSEIRVKADTPVEIRLRSDDTNHGFRIVGTEVNLVIPKRGKGVATVTFQPPKPGRYVFECSKLCGAGHSFMRGTLIVQ